MMLRWSNIRYIVRFSQRCSYYAKASVPTESAKVDENLDVEKKKVSAAGVPSSAEQSHLVAAAFASLQQISRKAKSPGLTYIQEKLNSAEDVDSLLSIAEQPVISKTHAFAVINLLSVWVEKNKCKPEEYNTDARYMKLCKILNRTPVQGIHDEVAFDLKLVLGITADDRMAKLINSVTLPQMVKMISSLGLKKRRSLPLLRSLSHNIANSTECMNVKEVADILYACATLNFMEEKLMKKIVADALMYLEDNKNPSVVKSIVNSLGILRYRNIDLLEKICSWFINNEKLCTRKESLSILYTLANLNYLPSIFENFMKIAKQHLNMDNMKNEEWLTTVWSLVVLNQYNESFIDSVLNPDFIQALHIQSGIRDIPLKLKLQNINGYAKLRGINYKGRLLDESLSVFQTSLSRSKEDHRFCDSIFETINSIVPSPNYVRANIDTKMGFLIDVEVILDAKREFVDLSGELPEKFSRVAIMASTYHCMCRGCLNQPTGITALIHRLITDNNYKLICIPYTEFCPREKLTTRVQYLEERLKKLK